MDLLGNKLKVVGANGEAVECDIISVFENEETGKHYLIYTDNVKNHTGQSNMFVVSYDPENPGDKLYPVETEEEWMSIAPILQEIRDKILKNCWDAQHGCSSDCCDSCDSTCGES